MSALPIGATVRCLYQFTGEDASEMNCQAGELLTIVGEENDGWTECARVANTAERGFVPTSYLVLRETSESLQRHIEVDLNANRQQQQRQQEGRSGSVQSGAMRLGSPATYGAAPSVMAPSSGGLAHLTSSVGTSLSHQAITEPASITGAGSHTGGGGASGSSALVASSGFASPVFVVSSSTTPNPAAVVETFMKNEIYFKQLMKQRRDAIGKLDAALKDAASEVDAAKDKQQQLSRRLRDLDSMVQKERKKWKERVEEERLLLAQRMGASGPPASSTTVTTTTYSTRAAR
jgi:hypothetical protein